MIPRLILLCLLAPQVILQSADQFFVVNLDGTWVTFEQNPTPPTPSAPPELPFEPLFPPLYSGLSNIWILTGEADPYSDLYHFTGTAWERLTDSQNLFPEAQGPLLSAAVEAINSQPSGILYRAKIRDLAGQDYNELFFYHWETGESEKMPFFGKNPIWSPDGTQLVGSRYHAPLYELWRVDLETGKESFLDYGCNPQWLGDWLAYDEHDTATWQNYTDCFASGEVAALNLLTGEKIVLTTQIESFVQLVAWVTD